MTARIFPRWPATQPLDGYYARVLLAPGRSAPTYDEARRDFQRAERQRWGL